MMTHVISRIDDCETAADVCKSVNLLQAIRWIAQAWEAVEPFTIIKCFASAEVLDKERNVVKAQAPPNGEDPFSDLEDDVSQVDVLLKSPVVTLQRQQIKLLQTRVSFQSAKT